MVNITNIGAVGFQGLLIMVCVAISTMFIQGIAAGGDPPAYYNEGLISKKGEN